MVATYCLIISLLFATHVNSTTYYVTSDDDSSTNNDTFTLQHYISNTEEYFSSNNELYFLPGVYHLNTTLLLKDMNNFTLSGTNDSTIMCTTYESIMIINITNFTMKNVNLIGCGKYHIEYIQAKYKNLSNLDSLMKTAGYSASVFIDDCKLITINNINIMADKGFAGLLVINAVNHLVFTNIKIQVNSSVCLPNNDHLNGIVFYYKHWKINYKSYVNININNLQYKTLGLCLCLSHYAIKLLFQHCSPIFFTIQNTTFCGLTNSSLLYYYDTKCTSKVKNKLLIRNLKICNNVGNTRLTIFRINLANEDFKEYIFRSGDHQRSFINFSNCQFTNNTNIESMIFISPTRSERITGYIEVQHGKFYNNTNVHFIKIKCKTEAFWQLNTYTKIRSFTIALNKHHNSDSLISIMSGIITIEGTTFFTKNGYYQNIIKMHLLLRITSQLPIIMQGIL